MDLSPRQIVNELNKHIIGQDEAKKAVAIALRVSTWLVKRMNTTFFQQLVNVVLLFSALSLMSQVAQGVLA